tara:strand:- start:62 stop:244 length:183 start_codon:yes stop_codon:yes gene_type:complete
MIWVSCDKRGTEFFDLEKAGDISEFIKDCDCKHCRTHKAVNKEYERITIEQEKKFFYGTK